MNHTDKSFHVFATSENDRENWIRNLSTYISRSRNDEGVCDVCDIDDV